MPEVSADTRSLSTRLAEKFEVLLEFFIHVIVGISIFATIAAAAVGLNLAVEWLKTIKVAVLITSGLEIAEYTLFGIDLLLFLIFLLKTAWRFAREI